MFVVVLRYATYYYDEEAGVQKRTLTKAYGILFKIELHGTVSYCIQIQELTVYVITTLNSPTVHLLFRVESLISSLWS